MNRMDMMISAIAQTMGMGYHSEKKEEVADSIKQAASDFVEQHRRGVKAAALIGLFCIIWLPAQTVVSIILFAAMAATYLGAFCFLRKCIMPNAWPRIKALTGKAWKMHPKAFLGASAAVILALMFGPRATILVAGFTAIAVVSCILFGMETAKNYNAQKTAAASFTAAEGAHKKS